MFFSAEHIDDEDDSDDDFQVNILMVLVVTMTIQTVVHLHRCSVAHLLCNRSLAGGAGLRRIFAEFDTVACTSGWASCIQ